MSRPVVAPRLQLRFPNFRISEFLNYKGVFMISSLILNLLMVSNFGSAHASPYTSSVERTSVSCKSRNVMDAGYSVRVHHEQERDIGYVCSVSFAGEDHEYFNGPLLIRRMSSSNSTACNLQLTDSQEASKRSLDIRISSTGYGRIMKLDGKALYESSESFADLICFFDKTFLQELGCRNSSAGKSQSLN